MKPSIGRIVHYVNLGDKDGKYPPEIQAAIITGVYQETAYVPCDAEPGNNSQVAMGLSPANKLGETVSSTLVDLRVLYRQGQFDMTCVPFSEEPKRGHWSWPPKV